jgi:soluble lytic murein transglycosylase
MEPHSKYSVKASITQAFNPWQLMSFLAVFLILSVGPVSAASKPPGAELEQFKIAWDAARRGDHDSFGKIKNSLQDYILYPYLQYEDFRNRRAAVAIGEMTGFLETHKDWAFSAGLRRTWLSSLAKRGKWADFVAHSDGVTETTLQCQRLRGKIILGQTSGVIAEAQKLWTVGKSQPDECDPVFAWLIKNDGIPASLAWERIQLAMAADNRGMAAYLARFVPKDQRRWLEDWQSLSRSGYSRLERMKKWPDNDITQMISEVSLQRLARKDASLAAKYYWSLEGHFGWGTDQRQALLRDIALYSAVELDDQTDLQMTRVPAGYRDTQLLEWWARFLLSRQDWSGLVAVIGQMPEETRSDDRWRYWLAQANLRSGQPDASSDPLKELAKKANYYGFLAADELGLAYNICPLQPEVGVKEIEQVSDIEGFQRALELRKANLNNWAIGEWSLEANRLPVEDLKIAAALAIREGWYDRAIFALGNSGDLRFYEWRFPLAWEVEIKSAATSRKLDPAWVYGTIRSESAMVETARSSANAMGLMQVTPATGKRVAKKHGLSWNGSSQLMTSAGNLPIGTAYLSDLLQDFRNNPVLVSGAYNAGPNAVRRWLDTRPLGEAAIWVETLPYFETRDYIPRVLAFTTIYDWRMGGNVERVSVRMPHIESGKISVDGSVKVVCQEQI